MVGNTSTNTMVRRRPAACIAAELSSLHTFASTPPLSPNNSMPELSSSHTFASTPPLSPTNVMAELSSSHTFALTPPLSPSNAMTAREDNRIIQDRPVRSAAVDNDMFESVLGLRKLEGKEPKHDMFRVIFGCLFAYIVLGLWIWTIFALILVINSNNCVDAFEHEIEGDIVTCVKLCTGKLASAHSITFGLLSAVVINETSSSDDSAMKRLSWITKPILKRPQADNANLFQKALYSAIVSLPGIYLVSWLIFGLWCFIYSISTPDGASGPLFYTGETWFIITIRASYSFFGVSEKSASNGSSHSHSAQQEYDEETGLLMPNCT